MSQSDNELQSMTRFGSRGIAPEFEATQVILRRMVCVNQGVNLQRLSSAVSSMVRLRWQRMTQGWNA
jgi:hypothetical protein